MQTDHGQQPDSSISNWQTSRLLSLIDSLPILWHETNLNFPFTSLRRYRHNSPAAIQLADRAICGVLDCARPDQFGMTFPVLFTTAGERAVIRASFTALHKYSYLCNALHISIW